MRERYEPENIDIKLQDNGEGRIKWTHRRRFRDERGDKIGEGDAKVAALRFSDFRTQSFTVDNITVTGAWVERLFAEMLAEAERQAAARERANAEAQQRAAEREAAAKAEQERVAAEQAALLAAAQQATAEAAAAVEKAAADAAAERERIELQFRGTAERGAA